MAKKIGQTPAPSLRPAEHTVKTLKGGKGQPLRVKNKAPLLQAAAAAMTPTRETPDIRRPTRTFPKAGARVNSFVQTRPTLIWSRKVKAQSKA